MSNRNLCIGVDFGTDSVRSLLVDASDGSELASSVFEYPRWKERLFCNPSENRYRQHPLDYIEGLRFTIHELLQTVKGGESHVRAITVDTTGSTPVAVNRAGIPLSLLPNFSEDPDAMFILWKDHSSIKEADKINSLCKSSSVDYSKYSGGVYSSEWFWAKIAHTISINRRVAREAFSWVEHCDWIPALLTGNSDALQIRRSRCAAGHKAMWNKEWGGLPPADFLNLIEPSLGLLRSRLYDETFTCDMPAGYLSAEWAGQLGLRQNVVVGTGGFDAHIGAVGGEIEPYFLSKVIGTSTCDMIVTPVDDLKGALIRGISGQVEGSIIPGMLGMEAGQSAFGDIYAWFRDLLLWPLKTFSEVNSEVYSHVKTRMIEELAAQAVKMPVDNANLIALDWLNGRRTPDANQHLKGAISGLTLGTNAPLVFRTLVESTAFGARMIVERFLEQNVPVRGILALGGVAKRSPYVMQILADTLNMPIKVVKSEHACALGAAMFAAVTAGIYAKVQEAQEKMGKGFDAIYFPDTENVLKYDWMFKKYKSLGRFIESGF